MAFFDSIDSIREKFPEEYSRYRLDSGYYRIGGIGESALIEISDASHLHFEMTLGGIAIDPLDYVMYDVTIEE